LKENTIMGISIVIHCVWRDQ